jgi:hypothetical protein
VALALTNANAQTNRDVFGRQNVVTKIVTFDASYPTGGESLTPADLGLAQIDILLVSVVSEGVHAGAVVQYDYTAKKLKVFVEEAVAAGGVLLEIANATDLSALKVRVLAIGL